MEPLEEAVPERLAQAEIDTAVSVSRRITDNIRKAVQVRDEVLEHLTVTMLSEGHILVEDYPGVGKTALARALSRSIDCQFARVQCTADLLPADIVGTQIYNQRESRFEFRPGPIFANVVLVDEVNRASPKTQSGLLECMQERQVTVEATSHELARPFLVFATQNPVEYEGTYPLPEAQVDRFMVRLSLGYPTAEDEAGMLMGHESRDRVMDLEPVADRAEIVDAVETAHRVHASARPARLHRRAAPPHPRRRPARELGASPRAGLMLLRAAKARALVHGRDHALPDDVQALADAVLVAPAACSPGSRRGAVARRDPASASADAVGPTPAVPAGRRASARACAALGAAAAARRRHVRRRAAVRHRRGADAARRRPRWAGSAPAAAAPSGARSDARGDGGGAAQVAHRPRRRAAAAAGLRSTSRCCPSRCALPAGGAARACASRSRSAAVAADPAAAGARAARPARARRARRQGAAGTRCSCCRLPGDASPARGRRDPRARAAPRCWPPRRPRSTACGRIARARRRRGSTGPRWPAAPG